MSESKVTYPCLYGLRDCCEAFSLTMLQGKSPIPSEPKTDEERVMKRAVEAMMKYMPALQGLGSTSPPPIYTMRPICEICPYRLAKLKELGAEFGSGPVGVSFGPVGPAPFR